MRSLSSYLLLRSLPFDRIRPIHAIRRPASEASRFAGALVLTFLLASD